MTVPSIQPTFNEIFSSEIKDKTLQNLPLPDLIIASMVCKQWQSLAKANENRRAVVSFSPITERKDAADLNEEWKLLEKFVFSRLRRYPRAKKSRLLLQARCAIEAGIKQHENIVHSYFRPLFPYLLTTSDKAAAKVQNSIEVKAIFALYHFDDVPYLGASIFTFASDIEKGIKQGDCKFLQYLIDAKPTIISKIQIGEAIEFLIDRKTHPKVRKFILNKICEHHGAGKVYKIFLNVCHERKVPDKIKKLIEKQLLTIKHPTQSVVRCIDKYAQRFFVRVERYIEEAS